MSVLDYQIPSDLSVMRGGLVRVPFRQKTIYGIVRCIKEKPLRGIRLKPVLSVIDERALTDKELSFFEAVASSVVQPVSNILYTYVPTPVKWRDVKPQIPHTPIALTIPQQEAATVSRIATHLTKQRKAFATSPDLRRSAAIISSYLLLSKPQKSMIVCPHIHDVKRLARTLDKQQPFVVTGEESRGERARVWRAFRSLPNRMLITTRAGMLYANESVETIFVIRSGHPDHVLHDRNPRLDTRSVLQLFSEMMFSRLYFLDVHPRPEDLEFFGRESLLTYPLNDLPQFIDTERERPASAHPVLTSSCLSAIEQTVARQERVLLIYNQKGYAHRLRCTHCREPVACEQCRHPVRLDRTVVRCIHCTFTGPIPLTCNSCHHNTLTARGYGIDRIADAVAQLFPTASYQIIDQKRTESPTAQIILATRLFLEQLFDPFQKNTFGIVIHLDPDTALFSPDVRASHRAVWSLAEWRGLAHAFQAPFLVQTSEPDWFATRLLNPEQSVCDELDQRRIYGQPPCTRWVTVRLEEPETRKREMELQILKDSLQRLPHISTSAMEKTLLVKFPAASEKQVLDLFSALDDRYIIDMNAYHG